MKDMVIEFVRSADGETHRLGVPMAATYSLFKTFFLGILILVSRCLIISFLKNLKLQIQNFSNE